MARTFKIFYSWQSDLPAKDTKNFIGDAIDAAVKFLANTVTVIPDRDTKTKQVLLILNKLFLTR